MPAPELLTRVQEAQIFLKKFKWKIYSQNFSLKLHIAMPFYIHEAAELLRNVQISLTACVT